MDSDSWEMYYRRIIDDFGFSREKDEASARVLEECLTGKMGHIDDIEELVNGKDVWVVGNAPSLPAELKTARPYGTLIAADGATSVLLANGFRPHIIVSDLDGNIDDILRANESGSLVLIHAHGDNIDSVRRFAPRFDGNVIGTTQSTPFDDIQNFGGFTDGDRAVFLADHFDAGKITLLGFDFENVGKEEDVEKKQKKLDWAYILIQSLANPNITFWSPSSSSE
jgi:uncharacterized Rossmann fold enzyme